MRLRQAHAILETVTALEAAELDFELWPFDHDREDAAFQPADDFMSGFAQFTDPDMNGFGARTYNVDIKPSPTEQAIEATLVFGFDDNAPCLFHAKVAVGPVSSDEVDEWRGLVGAGLAARIAEAVREHEKPYQAAYAERTTEK